MGHCLRVGVVLVAGALIACGSDPSKPGADASGFDGGSHGGTQSHGDARAGGGNSGGARAGGSARVDPGAGGSDDGGVAGSSGGTAGFGAGGTGGSNFDAGVDASLDADGAVGNGSAQDAADSSDGGVPKGGCSRPEGPPGTGWQNGWDGKMPCDTVCSIDGWCWEEPFPTSNQFFDIWVGSNTNVWILGDHATILHWDGEVNVWSGVTGVVPAAYDPGELDTPPRAFLDIHGSSETDVWVIGENRFVAHWDGQAWHRVPLDAGGQPRAVWALAPDDAWLVGDGGSVWHWDGFNWDSVATETTAALKAIWVFASDDLWLAGESTALHWSGSTFQDRSTGLGGSDVRSLWGRHPGEVWSAGGPVATWTSETGQWTQRPPVLSYWDTPAPQYHVSGFSSGAVFSFGSTPVRCATIFFGCELCRWNETGSQECQGILSFNLTEGDSEIYDLRKPMASGTTEDRYWVVMHDTEYVELAGAGYEASDRIYVLAEHEMDGPDPGRSLRGAPLFGRYDPRLWGFGASLGEIYTVTDGELHRRTGGTGQLRWQRETIDAGVANIIGRPTGSGSDDIWVVTSDGKASHWDGQSWTVSTVEMGGQPLNVETVGSAAWTAVAGNVYRWSGASWDLECTLPEPPSQLAVAATRAWVVGSDAEGLAVLRECGSGTWRELHGLEVRPNRVQIGSDSAGKLWVGVEAQGGNFGELWNWDGSKRTTVALPAELVFQLEARGEVWVPGSTVPLAYRWNGSGWETYDVAGGSPLPNETKLRVEGPGNVWANLLGDHGGGLLHLERSR